MKKAILLTDSFRTEGSYAITTRFANGIIIGEQYGDRPGALAIHQAICRGTKTLRPIVGGFRVLTDGEVFGDDRKKRLPPQGWIHPSPPDSADFVRLSDWRRALRLTSRLEWHKRLGRHIQVPPSVKIAIEDFSLQDIEVLRDLGWYIGRSAHAPLWRVYALVPVTVYQGPSADFPHFEGRVRTLKRFGRIFDPEKHKVVLKLKYDE